MPGGIYIGIDLGTTNSAVAFGGISNRDQRCGAHIIEIQRRVDVHQSDNKSLLPSFLYLSPSGSSFVGDYAKKHA